ncbi:MAG: hypothetical protein VKJ24_11645 [Synechococcales bacterium]|nr:hypothetical protein [Synechococcales bacterium]
MTYPARFARTLTLFGIGTWVSAGLWLAAGQPGQAQTAADLDPLKDFRTDTNSDPFSNRGDASSSMFNLIHRAMQGSMGVDPAEVAASQRESVDEATAQFLARQRQLLKSPTPAAQPAVPGASAVPAIVLPGTVSPNTVMPDGVSGTSIVP